jgi:hypothetical protein
MNVVRRYLLESTIAHQLAALTLTRSVLRRTALSRLIMQEALDLASDPRGEEVLGRLLGKIQNHLMQERSRISLDRSGAEFFSRRDTVKALLQIEATLLAASGASVPREDGAEPIH